MTRIPLSIAALLVCLGTTAQAQQAANLEQLEWRRGVYLQRPAFEPYTGPVIATWPGGAVRERGAMSAGRWDGVREIFYQDGQLAVREGYRNGVLHGPFEAFFRTGSPSATGTYVDGQLDGPYASYWLREPAELGAWTAGRECGEWVRYFPTSSLGLRVETTIEFAPCPVGSD